MDFTTPILVRHAPGEVLMEPAPVPGIKGNLFTVHMTPERARKLGHALIDAATMAMRATCSDSAVQRG